MNRPRKLTKVQERNFSAHHMLIRVARFEADLAQDSEEGRFDHSLIAITFSALAIEAMCNAFGERVIPDWEDFGSSSPYAKLRVISTKLSIPHDSPQFPWCTLRELIKFRNGIAHPKPEPITETLQIDEHKKGSQHFNQPLSKLEKKITPANAMRSVKAVEEMLDELLRNMSPEDKHDLRFDSTYSVTKLPDQA